jgi:predicted Zn finger-like uncharacterized protein
MKFVCDKCQTRYSIADERVHGRVLKIRCKSCANIITVREERAATLTPVPVAVAAGGRHSAVSPLENAIVDNFGDRPGIADNDNSEHTTVASVPFGVPPPAQIDDWYVSFDGEQEGPFSISRAVERIRSERTKGREAHAWRPGFFVWLAVEEVPELAEALKPRGAPPPPVPAKPPSVPSLPVAAAKPARLDKDPTPAPVAKQVTKPETPTARDKPATAPVPKTTGPVPKVPTTGPVPKTTGPVPKVSTTGPVPKVAAPATPSDWKPAAKPADKPAAPSQASVAAAAEKPRTLEPATTPIPASAIPTASAVGESGPKPLPPPPAKDDILIGEPSGLFNMSHLAALTGPGQNVPRGLGAKAAPAPEAPAPVPVAPAQASPAAAPPATASPVVVVAGPAPRHLAPWVRLVAVFGILVSVGLGVTLVVVLRNKPTVVVGTPTVQPPAPKVEDKPIALADSAPTPVAPPKATPPTPTPAAPSTSKRSSSGSGSSRSSGNSKLNEAQKNLAALYSEDGGRSTPPREIAAPDRNARASTQVSQTALLNVVTQNRRTLNACYERVLKHDNTLKRARLVAHVKVGISGTVLGATIDDPEYAKSEIGTCITGAMKRWRFPASDGEYETELPILLQAE